MSSNYSVLGTTLDQVDIQVGNGQTSYKAQPGQGLVCVLVSKWQEGALDDIRAKLSGVAPAPAAPAPAAGTQTGQFVAQLVSEVEQALANDGKIDDAEKEKILADVLSHFSVPASLAGLVNGHLNVGQAVTDVLGHFWGRK